MLTEREEMIVDLASRVQVVEKLGCDPWTLGWNAAMQFMADAIERGAHLKRPEPTIPASE